MILVNSASVPKKQWTADVQMFEGARERRPQRMTDTPELVRRAQQGDQQALEALVARYDRYVLGVALLTLGDRSEAQDAAQEALIKALRGLKGFKGESAFDTWLYRVTVNTCRDFQRRLARRRETALESEPSQLRADGPLQATLDRERRQAVWDAVQALEPSQREAIILRYYLDMSGAEIAEVTGAPPGTVYWRLHQARETLAPLLAGDTVLADEVEERAREAGTANGDERT
jgi:RNA polymerase sigma-70 factor (ECF subfamily)